MSAPIAISDKALVKWMERTGLVDLTPIRDALAESVADCAKAAGNLGVSNYLILADGLVYLIKDGVLETVVSEDGRHKHVHLLAKRGEVVDRG